MTGCRNDLVFDVGLHRGEDSAAYLAQGYRVVAFEADPELAHHCRERFAAEITAGRMTIVEGAIAPGDAATVKFYRNPGHSYWGTIDMDWAERNQRLGEISEPIELRRTDFAAELSVHGIPLYAKIDVEGADRHVLETLASTEARPFYVSIESSQERFADLQAEIALLDRLGYRAFRIVQQANLCNAPMGLTTLNGARIEHKFEPGGSGAWGKDLTEPWLSRDETLAAYSRIFAAYRAFGEEGWVTRIIGRKAVSWLVWRFGVTLGGWHDVHARLAPPD